MLAFLLSRIGQALVAIWGVVTIVFFILHFAGNPALLLAPQNATAAEIHHIEVQLGLNRPLLVQYGIYVGDLLRGNFGYSYTQYEPALWVVGAHVVYTVRLALAALALTILVGVPLGTVLAVYNGRLIARLLFPVVVAGQSMPAFWSGLLLIYLFSVTLHWLPSSGATTASSIVLPAVTLAGLSVAAVARMTRSSMLEELRKDYVRTARAKGLPPWKVIGKHMLRNASIAVVTILTLQLANLLGGAVITETIFAWPGLGELTIQSINALDFPVVETIVILGSSVYILANLLADLSYSVLDPRILVRAEVRNG